jgi:two-component system nitrate/nitrite response regulator NarL
MVHSCIPLSGRAAVSDSLRRTGDDDRGERGRGGAHASAPDAGRPALDAARVGGGRGSAGGPIRVLVAAGEPLFGAGLMQLLEGAGMQVAGYTSDAAQIAARCRELQPDVLALDPAVATVSLVDLLHELGGCCSPRTLLLAASASSLDASVLALGVRGIVLKSAEPRQFLAAVRAVAAGEHWIGRQHAARLLDSALGRLSSGRQRAADGLELLTRRERDIIAAIVTGASNRAIASRLKLSPHTVKHHLTSIFDKLKVSSRAELVVQLGGDAARPKMQDTAKDTAAGRAR